MARQSRKLTALEIGRLKDYGTHPVGESLYLQISKSGTKSWLFRYSSMGKGKWMGLGSYGVVSIAQARERVIDLKRELLNNVDPLEKKYELEGKKKLEDAKRFTFDDCAKQYIESLKPSWKNDKHAAQWENTIKTYASPLIGNLSIGDIDTDLVLKVLEPIWYVKTETASRLRGRIERVLSWSIVRGMRKGPNPALWRGHLEELLPKRSKIQKVTHFKALPFIEIAEFLERLRSNQDIASLALEFTILTAARSGETLGATWNEINETENLWTIPADRMKAGKEHKVPLSDRAMQIIERLKELQRNEHLFPSPTINNHLSDMSMLMVIRRLGFNVTTHGFRSTFKDWASERTNFSRDVVEMALAHTIGGKVEAAYRRGDLYFKRTKLMASWAEFCSQVKPKVGTLVDLFEPEKASGLN